jgi:hypothetical protein
VSTAPRFDEIVHAPNRLQICAILSAVDSADFATVREGLAVADSVLSKHVRVLQVGNGGPARQLEPPGRPCGVKVAGSRRGSGGP